MLGIKCRLHDLAGDDRGIAHVPAPIAVGDLVAREHHEFRVVDVIVSPPGSPIGALVKVRPTRLRRLVAGLTRSSARFVLLIRQGSKPPIDPEQTRNPTSEESPEAFTLVSGPTWATGDEPCFLLVGHGDEVSGWRIRSSHETADSRPHCGRGPAIQSDYPARGVSRG